MRGCVKLFLGAVALIMAIALVWGCIGLFSSKTPGESETFQPGSPAAITPTDIATARWTPAPCTVGADTVIAFNPGPGAQTEYGEAKNLLHDPDMVEKPSYKGILQLGRQGSVLVAFTRNTIVDGDGPDFQVYGESAKDDFILLEVSNDGQTWYTFPKEPESTAPLDLTDVGLPRAVFVRITDLQPGTATGAELDAVVALNCGPAVDPLPMLPDAIARNVVALYDGPSQTSEPVGTVVSSTLLTIVGRSTTNEWVRVAATGGAQGWCRATDLAMNVRLAGFPAIEIPPTATPAPPAAGLSEWMVYEGKKVGVRDIAWNRSLDVWVPDTGKIFVSVYIIATNESDSEYTFSDSDFALVDGGGEISGHVLMAYKGPRFVPCTVKPGGTCEGWWTTSIWNRTDVRKDLFLRWDPCLFLCPPIETPILLTSRPAAKPRSPTVTPVLGIGGEQMKAGSWSFAVTEVQFRKALYFHNNVNVAAGVFCVLLIDIQSEAPGTAHFGELLWKLRDAQGKVYDPDTATVWAAWQFEGKDTPWTDLNPGQRASIVVAFDVAPGAKGLQLYSNTLERSFVSIGDAEPPQDQ